MRVEIIIVVLSACCLAEVIARMPETGLFCKSGVIGPKCRTTSECKDGFTCRAGFCCRDSVCPAGMIGELSCNLNNGQTRCTTPYRCINNFCCKDKIAPPPKTCPKGTVKVGVCPKYPLSKYGGDCPRGATCHNGLCCKSIKQDLCPKVKPPRHCPVYKKNPDKCQVDKECPRGICCKGPCDLCPRVKRPKNCPVYIKNPDECQVDKECPRGICCKGHCGVKRCYNHED